MLDSAQFLHILAAEAELLVTVSIYLTNEAKAKFERQLNDAFASDSYSDIARSWNEERSRVVQEALEYHLIPIGTKWAREWLREEVEDALAIHCGNKLKEVGHHNLLYFLANIVSAHRCRPLCHWRRTTWIHTLCPCYLLGEGGSPKGRHNPCSFG
jgi:hypothetical protein